MAASNPPVNAIIVECAIAVGKALGDKKVPTKTAKFWAKMYEKSITEALINKGVWARDRRGVLVMAKKLGKVTRRLTGSNDSVTVAVAKKASAIISKDPACPGGGGKYCPPR
jgi:hypothetical protein